MEGAEIDEMPSRDVMATHARWGREKGDIAVTNLLTGETVEIPYTAATDVWKEDIRRQRSGRRR
jgi:hypothetical protein